ncbi:class I SAM-dependent methyltransferase [Anaerolineales bacterium HSG6]|nr:class I SAM-dependent methyltransferase [Anaerolineales bacterium HSG6]MDM8531053.1 class I SAM-dependent methyltransferase [Anaerolineales bacterium HSG25]
MTERINPNNISTVQTSLMALRHLAVYQFVKTFIPDKKILDLGCGVGYGTLLLANTAKQAVGLDRAFEPLKSNSFSTSPIFVNGNSERLPFPDNSFDIVISLQVIEHIQDDSNYLQEIKRIILPGGTFIVSTPNKASRLWPYQPPFNPYHVREYDQDALKGVLTKQFSSVEIMGLQAQPEIMAIEQTRLKQNPIRVYSELLFPPVVVDQLKTIRNSLKNDASITKTAKQISSSQDSTYTSKDFWVSHTNITMSLDLIGICRK